MVSIEPAEALKRLLAASSTQAVEAALEGFPIVSPDNYQRGHDGEHIGGWREGHLHWLPVGADRGNAGRIKLAGEPTKPSASMPEL